MKGRVLLWAFAALALWEALARAGIISPWAAPAPSRLPAAFWALLQSGELAYGVGTTLLRVAVAFAAGSAAGFAAGIGEVSRAVPAVLACFTIAALHGMDAVAGVRREFIELARCSGAHGWALMRAVLIPSCLPSVFAGLRLALGMALVMVVSVEMVGQPSGLGGMIWVAGQSLAIEKLFVGMILAAVLGSALLQGMRSWNGGLRRGPMQASVL
ncbi:MAG: ABC transporter permease subunit [Acidobacteria bacterium]|nr:ABC transporter permease subunit [Acidobacteriota bacterium]